MFVTFFDVLPLKSCSCWESKPFNAQNVVFFWWSSPLNVMFKSEAEACHAAMGLWRIQLMVAAVILLLCNKTAWWNVDREGKGQLVRMKGDKTGKVEGHCWIVTHVMGGGGCCLEASSGDGKRHSDQSKVSWRIAELGRNRGEERDKRQSATKQKKEWQHKQREEGGGGGREVWVGPAPNPASALGLRNRGVISVKTHSQPVYR